MASNSNLVTGIKYGAIALVALLLFIYLRGCFKKKDVTTPGVRIDTITTVRIDTFVKKDTHYVPKPYKVVEKEFVPVSDPMYIPVDTAQILADYNSIKYYRDTLYSNDSFGVVVVKDTVSRNSIIGRGKIVTIKSLVFDHTIIKTETLPRRVTGYWGITGGGNVSNIFTTGGVTFGIQDKKLRYYGLSANLLLNSKPFYGVQFMSPIHLKKR
jgi:hypothetical protein